MLRTNDTAALRAAAAEMVAQINDALYEPDDVTRGLLAGASAALDVVDAELGVPAARWVCRMAAAPPRSGTT